MIWSILSPSKQIDEVGNIFQKSGAVQPKACQKCEKKFTSEVEEIKKKI